MTMRERDFERSVIELKKENEMLRKDFRHLQKCNKHVNEELSLSSKAYREEHKGIVKLNFEAENKLKEEIYNLQIHNNSMDKLYDCVRVDNSSLCKEMRN